MQLERVQAGTLSNCPLAMMKLSALLVKAPRAAIYYCPHRGLLNTPAEKPAAGKPGEGEGQEKFGAIRPEGIREAGPVGPVAISPDSFQSEG